MEVRTKKETNVFTYISLAIESDQWYKSRSPSRTMPVTSKRSPNEYWKTRPYRTQTDDYDPDANGFYESNGTSNRDYPYSPRSTQYENKVSDQYSNKRTMKART